jgi:hypothetical protein
MHLCQFRNPNRTFESRIVICDPKFPAGLQSFVNAMDLGFSPPISHRRRLTDQAVNDLFTQYRYKDDALSSS